MIAKDYCFGLLSCGVVLMTLISSTGCSSESSNDPGSLAHIAVIKDDTSTGFSNGGWSYDRYKSLESLDAHSKITVAELDGPGIITHIHTTRHRPTEVFARGIVLEIYFNGSETPAVHSPLADFFGDGCNGKSKVFSTPLIECAPWSYNCYFPMPFEISAKVVLRNDTDLDARNYSYLEWEALPEWKPEFGYFHATYQRRSFQLTKESNELMFQVEGKGHFLGRQYSIATDEPLFRHFMILMEGNNEVAIDGEERALDYLGTEDSFTFSWGFIGPFIGIRAGMPVVDKESTQLLSIYRFHDHMPIRFERGLIWRINWTQERRDRGSDRWQQLWDEWGEAVSNEGCWVNYATVHYCYLDDPGGLHHLPLPPVEQRSKNMIPVAMPQ